jgi:hypothetical protein
MQMAMWQVSRWQKKEHPCLAGGEEGRGRSWCYREDISRWPEVVALPEVGEKREKVRPAEREEKSGKKDDFLPKFHTNFFLFGE